MKQPKWQRARILEPLSKPDIRNALIWVECSPPQTRTTIGMDSRTEMPAEPRFRSNLQAPNTHAVVAYRTWRLELLPEFADDVELIPWEQFLADCKENANAR